MNQHHVGLSEILRIDMWYRSFSRTCKIDKCLAVEIALTGPMIVFYYGGNFIFWLNHSQQGFEQHDYETILIRPYIFL